MPLSQLWIVFPRGSASSGSAVGPKVLTRAVRPAAIASHTIRLLWSRNSLILVRSSLFSRQKFPVPLNRKFGQKPEITGFSGRTDAQRRPKFAKFPVLFLVSKESPCRDRFDRDCVRHHALGFVGDWSETLLGQPRPAVTCIRPLRLFVRQLNDRRSARRDRFRRRRRSDWRAHPTLLSNDTAVQIAYALIIHVWRNRLCPDMAASNKFISQIIVRIKRANSLCKSSKIKWIDQQGCVSGDL